MDHEEYTRRINEITSLATERQHNATKGYDMMKKYVEGENLKYTVFLDLSYQQHKDDIRLIEKNSLDCLDMEYAKDNLIARLQEQLSECESKKKHE